jgi:hypothetical protein
MTLRYDPKTDSLGIFFGDTMPWPLYEEDQAFAPGIRLLSDEPEYFVGISILKASTKLPTGRKLSTEEILAWLEREYPDLIGNAGAKFEDIDPSRN